ncbi:MAG: bifunctional nicotinamidase/pyrazinamidase [Desulfobacterales bacterium]|nr:bifunctional nicotinamidase/pyrazinamidase [Desulfobacterales bacterium]
MKRKALILVDIQNDFIPGGALAVEKGDEVVAVANSIMEKFDIVVASQDYHPKNHLSFASQHEGKNIGDVIDLKGLPQNLWPDHCIENTKGSEFVKGLDVSKINEVFQKGMDREIDSYSAFFDNGRKKATGLSTYLGKRMIDEVYVMGLATDYCVKFTALDSLHLGFNTKVIKEGIRAVELEAGDSEKAIKDMENPGIEMVSIDDL